MQVREAFLYIDYEGFTKLDKLFSLLTSLPTKPIGKVDCLCQCQIQLIENNSSDVLYSATLIK